VLAGVQALEISAFDEAYRTPCREAHIVGLRTQQILDLETGVGRVIDPLGGSYFVESLTDQLEQRIRARIEEIEAKADPETLAESGLFREIFHQAMEDAQIGVETGATPVVGVNVHLMAEKDDTLLRDVAASKIRDWRDHTEAIERFKCERNVESSRRGLDKVAAAVRSSENLIPAVVAALDASATVGEISTVMRAALGAGPDIFDHALPGATAERHVA
jgi:methylmalonyl-CoA mutase N-terminal domain/subunit